MSSFNGLSAAERWKRYLFAHDLDHTHANLRWMIDVSLRYQVYIDPPRGGERKAVRWARRGLCIERRKRVHRRAIRARRAGGGSKSTDCLNLTIPVSAAPPAVALVEEETGEDACESESGARANPPREEHTDSPLCDIRHLGLAPELHSYVRSVHVLAPSRDELIERVRGIRATRRESLRAQRRLRAEECRRAYYSWNGDVQVTYDSWRPEEIE